MSPWRHPNGNNFISPSGGSRTHYSQLRAGAAPHPFWHIRIPGRSRTATCAYGWRIQLAPKSKGDQSVRSAADADATGGTRRKWVAVEWDPMGAICAPTAADAAWSAGESERAICAPAAHDPTRSASESRDAICAPATAYTARRAHLFAARSSSREAEEASVEALVGVGNRGHCSVGGSEPLGEWLHQYRCGKCASDRDESESVGFRGERLCGCGQLVGSCGKVLSRRGECFGSSSIGLSGCGVEGGSVASCRGGSRQPGQLCGNIGPRLVSRSTRP